jgi:hypothetical protein
MAMMLVENDYNVGRSLNLATFEAIFYSLMTCGNLFYAFKLPIGKKAEGLWRTVTPFFLLFFVVSGFMSDDLNQLRLINIQMYITVWLVNFLVFVPTFWANFRIANYRHKPQSREENIYPTLARTPRWLGRIRKR